MINGRIVLAVCSHGHVLSDLFGTVGFGWGTAREERKGWNWFMSGRGLHGPREDMHGAGRGGDPGRGGRAGGGPRAQMFGGGEPPRLANPFSQSMRKNSTLTTSVSHRTISPTCQALQHHRQFLSMLCSLTSIVTPTRIPRARLIKR